MGRRERVDPLSETVTEKNRIELLAPALACSEVEYEVLVQL